MKARLINAGPEGSVDSNIFKAVRRSRTKVNCDSCKKEFDIVLKTSDIKGFEGTELTYFVCPHCDRMYKVKIDNEYTKLLAGEIRARQAAKLPRGSGKSLEQDVLKHELEIENLKSRLEKEFASLDEKFSKLFTSDNK